MALVFIVCAVVSCEESRTPVLTPRPALSAENKEREKLGLRLVKTNWFLYSRQFGEENWKLDASAKSWAKKIHLKDNDNVLWEEDYYYSGKTFLFPPDKGETGEMLVIHYDYGPSLLEVNYVGQDPDILALMKGISPGSTLSNKLSVADEILKKWNIPRL